MQKLKKIWKQNKGFIVFLFLMLFFRSAIADWYYVPSGSMQPTILIGDRVYVNKLAYDVNIPFTSINLNHHADPQRGDVIVFDSKVSKKRLIKRVIGVPGDTIELKDNRLFVNFQPVDIKLIDVPANFDPFLNDRDVATYYHESSDQNGLFKESHDIRLQLGGRGIFSSFSAVKIPEDSFWVMGDNRDNSSDSRVIGVVPRGEVIGRAEKVIISLDKENYYLPRSGRYVVKL